jgi:DNA-binding IclR family transcriptional regulator
MANFPETTLERGLYIIDALACRPEGCAFKELQALCGMPASTTLNRLLKVLVETGHVCKLERRYGIGASFLTSARRALRKVSVEDILAPFVRELSAKTGDSAAYFHWDGDWIFVCVKHDVPEGLHFAEIGYRNHPPTHAFFQAIQPWLPEEALFRVPTDPATPVEEIRNRGYVDKIETYHYPHIRITAPVFYGSESVAGSLGIAIPTTTLPDEERNKRLDWVADIARKASEALASYKETLS